MPLVNRLSVIVPTHGRVDLFVDTLNSIQAQTIDDFELIVSDDSSVEQDQREIAKAVEKYQAETRRTAQYVFTKARLGQSGNTNQGMRHATAPVMRILHSDDLLRPGCLEWEISQFERRSDLELLFQDCLPFLDPKEIVWNESPLIQLIEPTDFFRQCLSTSTALPSGMLFTRSSYEAVGGMREDWNFLCDWDFFARLLLRAANRREFVGYAKAGNYGWRLHEDSTTTTKWDRHFVEHRQLMADWNESLDRDAHDLFVSPEDRQQFFHRGEQYRRRRLIEDVCSLSPAQFQQAIPWFNAELEPRLRRKVIWKYRKNAWKKTLRNWTGGQEAVPKPNAPDEAPMAEVREKERDWKPDVIITPFYGSEEIAADTVVIQVPYDNSMNLWAMREQIAAATKVRIAYSNANRFFRLSIAEGLKYVSPGAEVEFAFEENNHLTWFGLKAVVDMVAPGRFQVTTQEKGKEVEGASQYSNWKVRYQCVKQDHPWHLEPISGVTVGVLTLGERKAELDQLVDSVRQHCHFPYEIILIAPKELERFQGEDDVRQITFSERDDLGWITRKKNLICEVAQYSDLVICHDRFYFTKSFFEAFDAWGSSYGIAATRLKLPDGRRALDWGVVQGENFSWCQGGLLSYRDYSRYSYVPGGVTMIRKSFWRNFPWSENLFWNEHEDVELCRRIQRAGQRPYLFPGLMIAIQDRWVDENPLLPYSDQFDLP